MTYDLTEENLQQVRSVAELLPWVESCIAQIGSTNEGRRSVRLRQGLAKPLVEEALPIGIFGMHHFGATNDVSIRLVLGNQNYDAEVQGCESQFSFIEVTQAHEGEDEHLRMLVLEEKGHVSTVGEVQKSGTKATGITVDVETIAVSHEAQRDKEIGRIGDAIERKIGKDYPARTALVVVFDDYISIQNDDDIAALREFMQTFADRLQQFDLLAVVGWSKKTYLELSPV